MNCGVLRHGRRRRSSGWILLDLITGLIILLVLLTTLTAALSRHHRGEQQLADTRAAVRLAEQTATALQMGYTPPTPPEGESIEIVPLPPSSPANEPKSPVGHAWVRIRVTNRGRAATLVALTPSTQPAGGAK